MVAHLMQENQEWQPPSSFEAPAELRQNEVSAQVYCLTLVISRARWHLEEDRNLVR